MPLAEGAIVIDARLTKRRGKRPGDREFFRALARPGRSSRADSNPRPPSLGPRVSLFPRRDGRQRCLRRCHGTNGQTWDNDVFELFFKPATNRNGYYEFQVNATNTSLNLFLPSRGAGGYTRFRHNGKSHLESAVVVNGTLNQWQDQDRDGRSRGGFRGGISCARGAVRR